MSGAILRYGPAEVAVGLPVGVRVGEKRLRALVATEDPLAVVARALDAPVGAPPLAEFAHGARRVAVVVPDRTREAGTRDALLPILARLARAGLTPDRITIVVARGIHAATPRDEVARIVGEEVVEAIRVVQSAPESPESNLVVGEDPEIGTVRVHRAVAEADLVVLTGAVAPHHLAGFSGGAKGLVPGVADQDTVHAAHRVTLRALVAPDGSIRPVTGRPGPNPFRDALLRVARAFGRCWSFDAVLDDLGRVAAARGGEPGAAHEAAVADWIGLRAPPERDPADLVLVGGRPPRDLDLVQAHKALLEAAGHAKPGAPIVWLARAPEGPGHPEFLPWFEIRRSRDHLAALRTRFHPYGLTAYSVRRIAESRPVLVVSEVSPEILRPMRLLPFPDAQTAVDHALGLARVESVLVIPSGTA
jgi:nickel-dependent lactate racemase